MAVRSARGDVTPPKPYTLHLPEEVYEILKKTAREQHITVAELLRKFIKLGLIASEVEKDPNAKLIIREGDTERQLILI